MPVQKEALRELSRAGEAYRFLLSERDLAVLVLSENVEDCNEAACQLFGVTRDEFIGRSPLEFAPPNQPDGLPSETSARERLASALAGLPQWCTWQYRRKDGKLVDTLVHVEAVRVDGVRRVLIRIRDVSRLERAEVALAENEMRLQQILDNTTTAIVFAKDLAGRYLFVNRAFERLVGLPQREIVGKKTTDLFPAETAATLMADHASAIAEGGTVTVEEQVNFGGQTRTLLTNKFPLLDTQGRPYAICGIAADITERKRTEDALQRASLAVSTAGGVKGLESLAEHLASVLETDVAFVSVFTDAARNRMRTLAAVMDGRLLRSYEYDLADSPCAGIIGRVFRFVPTGALAEIPPGSMFNAKGMDSYAAYALSDSAGAPLGLIAVMNRAPLTESERVEAILKIFAVRAAAEIERTRNEEALRSAALAVSVAGGENVFRELVDALARILGIEFAFIALHKPGAKDMLRMLAYQVRGKFIDDYEYPLAGTACETVVGQQYRAYPSRLADHFPLDKDFRDMRVESYAGVPLADARGHSIGIMSVMSCRPLPNPDLVESMLKIFSARAVTEIERMRADEALRTSEEQYRAIFNGSADALMLWNSSLQRVDVNPAYERIYGYSREEVLGGAYLEAPSPEEAERRRGLIRRALGGEPFQTELESVRKNGERVQVEVRAIPIQHSGEPHVLAIVRDVTERKRAEAAVRASEEQYRSIFNASVDGMLLWNADHRIVDVNEAFLEMHGYRRDELVGLATPAFIPGALQEKCTTLLPQILAGEPCHIEARGERKDGTPFDVEIHGVPMRYQGQPHVLVILRDVTARREAAERQRASEERYRLLFEMESDAILLVDVDTLDLRDVNRAAAELYGYTRDELLRMKVTDISVESAATQTSIRSHTGTLRIPLRHHRKKDGTVFQVEISSNLLELGGRKMLLAAVRDITERMRAQEKVRESEERYRLLFEMESDAIVVVDVETLQHLDVNRAAVELYGYSREELLALKSTDVSAEPADTSSAMSRGSAQPGTSVVRVPLRHHRKKDGTVFPVEITANFFELEGRKIMVAAIRDITERRMREVALRRSDDRLRATVQAALDCIITMDAHGRIVEFNPAAEASFGYRRDEVLGEILADVLIPERFRDAHRRGMERYLVSGDGPFIGQRIEVTAMRRGGTEFPAELAIAVAEGPDGKIFVGYLRDITERRQAIEALQSSEEQYRAIFNSTQDGMIMWDLAGGIVDINPAALAMHGYTRDEVARFEPSMFIPPESVEQYQRFLKEVATGKPFHVEAPAIRKDGSRFWADVQGSPVTYKGAPHLLAMIRDVTERKQAEEERARLEAQLRQAQKMEAIGHLTGGIAHDFNNILTSILGYIVLGAERQNEIRDAKLGKYLDQAQLAAQRARDLIQQMLTFSRGQRGERRPLVLTPLVRESVKLLRSSLPATIELKTDLAADVPSVLSDPVQLEQVLLNLCINARDAMTGAGTIRVGVRVVDSADGVCASCRQKVAGRFVELSVADAGTGVSPEVLDRMFEPFFTTKEVGKGSGMGLAMVHGIVHDHGGHIVVDTAPGRGTTFRLQFAPVETARSAVPAARAEPARQHPRPQLSGRVLVVDDEEMVGDFMAEMLANWGLEVTVKRNPIEAEVWFAHDPSRIDLAITDQTMPRLTGIELARRLTGVRPNLPVILYTGYSDAVSDETMAQSGVCALLKKPVDTTKLLVLLRAHLPSGGASANADLTPTLAAATPARRKPSAVASRAAPRRAPARRPATRGKRATGSKRAVR
ncbi:MAG: PAS domain S-box protein [Betaproteobacteria bacterium]|nr:PAS domain S-box protein [Betaproteobacteria bacterium]